MNDDATKKHNPPTLNLKNSWISRRCFKNQTILNCCHVRPAQLKIYFLCKSFIWSIPRSKNKGCWLKSVNRCALCMAEVRPGPGVFWARQFCWQHPKLSKRLQSLSFLYFHSWSCTQKSLGPPPHPRLVLFGIQKFTPIFLSEIRPQMGETNFTFGSIPRFNLFVLWFWPSFSQDLGLSGFFQSCSYSCIYDKWTPDQV